MASVVLDNVHKLYGAVHAVRGVSLRLEPGQVTGILGHNGAGKTTTIRMISGYITPDAGTIAIHGFDVVTARAQAVAQVGYLPESNPLDPELSVREYLDFRGRLFGLGRGERAGACARVIDLCWLGEVEGRRIRSLSKGFRQRVGLAAAMLHDPRVLLLDEPTNGLDPTQIKETRELIARLSQDRTLIISSHILSEIERLCNRVVVFAGGRVCADGTARDLAHAAGGGNVIMEARVPVPGLLERAIRESPGVDRVQWRELDASGWMEWSVAVKPGAGDQREVVATHAARCGAAVREIRATDATLERAFLRILETHGDGDGAEGGRAGGAHEVAARATEMQVLERTPR